MSTHEPPGSGQGPAIDQQEVIRLARLAQLQLRPDEVEILAQQLGEILTYMAQLGEVDVTGVAPTAQVQLGRLPLRPDDPGASLPAEIALAGAAEAAEQCFVVPPFVTDR